MRGFATLSIILFCLHYELTAAEVRGAAGSPSTRSLIANVAGKPTRHRHRLTVLTTSGPVEGTRVSMSKNEKVWAFLGIPYAEPPIGGLRFRVSLDSLMMMV